jgi:hypothetical protein
LLLLVLRWLKIEQHKLQNIDASWSAALAAAKEGGAVDVVYKLEALIGVKLPQAAGPIAIASASALAAAAGVTAPTDAVAAVTRNFQPDLALKQELHDIKTRKRQRLSNLTLPVPTPADTLNAVAAGVVESSSCTFNTGAFGTRQFGLPDPTCGAVPEGYVAIRCGCLVNAFQSCPSRHTCQKPRRHRVIEIVDIGPLHAQHALTAGVD